MVQMNRFAEQKLRHRSREKTYGHRGGKAAGGGEKKVQCRIWGVWCGSMILPVGLVCLSLRQQQLSVPAPVLALITPSCNCGFTSLNSH